jgi:hypothetical protein
MTEREYRSRKYPTTKGFGQLTDNEQRELYRLLKKSGCRLQVTHTREGNELVFLKVSVSGLVVDLAKFGISIINSLDEY